MMKKFPVLVALIGYFFCAVALADYAEVTADGRGAVASVNPLATQAGIAAFARGGNAIDAALAVAFTLGVVDSHNSGIGGGCFILARTAGGEIVAIDGREMAPAGAQRDMFVKDGQVQGQWSKTGALAIGVPGSVAALDQLQKRAGKLGFADVILPAAEIAESGFAIDKVFAARLSRTQDQLRQFPASAAIFLDKNGEALSEGSRLRQTDLARTYRRLAKKGPDYFYRGEFARQVAKWMKANGGVVRAADFASYHTELRAPVLSNFQGYQIVGFPPPSSGGVHVAQILNIVDQFPLATLSEADRYHLIIEAMKLAFADRAHWLGDPQFTKVPTGLISAGYAAQLANKIDRRKASAVPGFNMPPDAEQAYFGKHTTHIASADKDGNWVAITTTLNTSFGSKVTIPGTGVLMNNQMDDFSAQPGVPNAYGLVGNEANAVAPGKRPLSSMSPSLVLHGGEPVLTLGAAGGPTIISQVVQVLINRLALGMPLPAAMASPRVHDQWRPDTVFIDEFASPELKAALAARGHQLKVWPPFGATQAIALEQGGFVAQSEPRLQNR